MDKNQSWQNTLSPQQSAFVQSFLADGASKYQCLIAPTGSGKTAVVTTILQELFKQKGVRKALYIANNLAMAENLREYFRKMEVEIPVKLVDARRFRELISESPIGASPWPSDILALMTIDTAKSPRILDAIIQNDWDIVIFDSIILQSSGSKVLRQLVESKMPNRIFVMESINETLVVATIKTIGEFQITLWKMDILHEINEAPFKFELQVVDYERTQDEVDFIRSFSQLEKLAEHSAFAPSFVLQLASSSLYAAEQSLRQMRNKVAHQDLLSVY